MPPIVTLTMNPTIDENSSVEYVFSDVKLRCRAPSLEPGGGGINVARAVARLGGEALAVYAAGGPSGDLLKQLLDREDVPQPQRARRRDRSPVPVRLPRSLAHRKRMALLPRHAQGRPARSGIRRREREPAARRPRRFLRPTGRDCPGPPGAVRARRVGRAAPARRRAGSLPPQAEPARVSATGGRRGGHRVRPPRGGPAFDREGTL